MLSADPSWSPAVGRSHYSISYASLHLRFVVIALTRSAVSYRAQEQRVPQFHPWFPALAWRVSKTRKLFWFLCKMVDDSSRYSNLAEETLIELQERLGWKQSQLAAFLGITDRTFNNYKRGRHELRLSLWQIKRLIQAMELAGMNSDDLPDPPK